MVGLNQPYFFKIIWYFLKKLVSLQTFLQMIYKQINNLHADGKTKEELLSEERFLIGIEKKITMNQRNVDGDLVILISRKEHVALLKMESILFILHLMAISLSSLINV